MTVAALAPQVTYLEDGVSLNFPVPFRYLAPADLLVQRILTTGLVDVLDYGPDWNATNGPTDVGGTLTLTASVAGASLLIRRHTPRVQPIDYQTNDRFPAETHELGLDRDMLIEQEQDGVLVDLDARALKVPFGETIGTVPARPVRAQGILGFDGYGEPIILPSAELGSVAVVAQRAEFTAHAGDTTFATPSTYTVGYVTVYVNGVRLSEQEFTATDGAVVVLDEPCAEGDIVVLEGFLGSAVAGDAGSIMFLQAGAGMVERNAESKMREVVSIEDAAATGDGIAIEHVPLQKLVAAVGNYGGDLGAAGYLPSGLYRLGATTAPQSYSRISGDGPNQSVLRNDVNPIPAIPCFTAPGALIFSTFENMGARGQKSFLDVAGTTDSNVFRNLTLAGMADAGLHFRGALQTSVFDRVSFENALNGPSAKAIICESAICNRNTWRECSFKNLTDDNVTLAGSQDLVNIGPRHEGQGVPGKASYRLTGSHHAHMFGGYFEGGAEFDVAWTNPGNLVGSLGLVSFYGTHWTYYSAGVAHRTSIVPGAKLAYINCQATFKKYVPGNSLLVGYNDNIQVTQGGASFSKYGPRGGQVDLKGVAGVAATLDADFLTFTRPSAANVTSNQQAVSGRLRLTLSGYTGGFPQSLTKNFDILIEGKTSFPVALGQTAGSAVDNSGGAFVVTVTAVNQTTTAVTLHVHVTGLQGGGAPAILSAAFEWTGHSYTEGDEFVVTAP